jgi:hypothetical protein
MADQAQSSVFNPGEHLVRLENGDYLPVQWRLVWFHQGTGPRAGYVTIELEHDRQAGFAKFATVAWDGSDETWRRLKLNGVEIDVCGRVATGEGSETAASFPEYYEKAATKSLGRALAGLSFGTQFAPELDEKHRIVDSPVTRGGRTSAYNPGQTGNNGVSVRAQSREEIAEQVTALEGSQTKKIGREASEQGASEQQMASIRKLCAALGREEPAPETLTYTGASTLIRQLSREYNSTRRAS